MLLFAGALLLVLGIGSGLLLALAPLDLASIRGGMTPWVLFPALTVAGYLLLALPAKKEALPLISRIAGTLVLALGLFAAVGLVLISASVVTAAATPLSLWYVFAFGLVFGVAGLSAHRPISRRA